MKTRQQVILGNSQKMKALESASVDLMVTSPPYPMIEMWDDMFSNQKATIKKALQRRDGPKAFELMHRELDPVWHEVYRVLKPGGFACINIGDATRTINENFVLYPNHMRIMRAMLETGFSSLPCILWRKQTNAPNKFMGSGMLPAGAYVTLEHEYILIFRKGRKREFIHDAAKKRRRESAIFWEERNQWFSDVWMDIKGTRQELADKQTRMRSAAYPFELVYRLINMYSAKGDLVLDPFLGTGTTIAAAIVSGRNAVGYEIDGSLKDPIFSILDNITTFANAYLIQRLNNHLTFIKERIESKKPIKHVNAHYHFPVVTNQEKELLFNGVASVQKKGVNEIEVMYSDEPQFTMTPGSGDEKVIDEVAEMEKQIQVIEKDTAQNKNTQNTQISLFD